jgi:putative ABC transport system ATP-binding protein
MEVIEATAPPSLSDLVPRAATARPLLELSKIAKTFHTDDVETRALSNVELAVGKGEFISISGPSGSGKSTLLSILGLLDVPTAGEYRIDGQDTAKLDPVRRASMRNKAIGFIFQAFNLIGDLTIEENVELPLTYRGMPTAERRQRVAAALDGVRMSHRARHLPAQLSGGQQQRVAVARAIAGDPLILLADEPTGNLDSKNGDAVMELLEQLHAKGATICMVTHNPDYARKATRVVHLFDGRVVEDRRG